MVPRPATPQQEKKVGCSCNMQQEFYFRLVTLQKMDMKKKCAAAYQKFAYLEKQLNQNLFVLSFPAKW